MLLGNQYIYHIKLFSRIQPYARAYVRMDFITWLINLGVIPFTNMSKTSKYIQCYGLFSSGKMCPRSGGRGARAYSAIPTPKALRAIVNSELQTQQSQNCS